MAVGVAVEASCLSTLVVSMSICFSSAPKTGPWPLTVCEHDMHWLMASKETDSNCQKSVRLFWGSEMGL